MNNFTQIPNEYIDNLNALELGIVSKLLRKKDYMEFKGKVENGWFPQSKRLLMKECGMKNNTSFDNYLNSLIQKGIIETRSTQGETAQFKVNLPLDSDEHSLPTIVITEPVNGITKTVTNPMDKDYKLIQTINDYGYTYIKDTVQEGHILYKLSKDGVEFGTLYVHPKGRKNKPLAKELSKIKGINKRKGVQYAIYNAIDEKCFNNPEKYLPFDKKVFIIDIQKAKENRITSYSVFVQDKADEMRSNPTNGEQSFGNIFSLIKDINDIVEFQGIEKQKVIVTKRGKRYIADFVIGNNIIEIDGGYHNTEEQQKLDKERTNELKEMGYKVFRFTNQQVIQFENAINLIHDTIYG